MLLRSVSQSRYRSHMKKNFQIWLKEGEREFRPNHLRVMIDLNLRIRSRGDLKERLLFAFDNIFYGRDPLLERIILASTKEVDIVLDPFTGSSTTGLAAYKHDRNFIGIELEKEYLDLSIKRFNLQTKTSPALVET